MKSRQISLYRVTAVVLALFFALSNFAVRVNAVDNAGFDVTGSKEASPVELDEDNRTTTVKLTLPAGEYQNKVDIVFVMDSSSSSQNSAVFEESVNDLFASIIENNPNIDLKVGVVRFRGRAHDAVSYCSDGSYKELVPYNDDTKGSINNALTMDESTIKAAFGNGSNTHGGIDMADEWLAADTEVPNDHKYVVLLTDCKTYIWNDDDNEPTTIYAQWFRSNSYAMQNSGKPAINQSFSYNKYAYSVDVLDPSGLSNIFVFKTYQELYDSTSEELTGVSTWDAPCYYADDRSAVPNGTVVKHTVTNGAALFGSNSATYGKKGDLQYYYEFTPSGVWTDVPYLEANPFMVTDNGDGTYTFDTENINPNYYLYHVDNLQKGMYKAGHLWTEMGEKYNCAAITYSGGSNDTALSTIRPSFINWLQENSKYGADIKDSAGVKELFTGIDNDIRYMVASGVVTDKIPEEFSLAVPSDGSSPFKMTLAGEALASAPDGENKWVFGEPNAEGVYPYVVEYDPGESSYKWTLNVPVENTRKVTLSYDLELKEEYAKTGWYDTNVEAKLDYVTTDGDEGTFVFEIPKVHYSEKTSVKVTKVWDDGDDKDGIRPGSVSIQLYADDEEAGRAVALNENGNWTYTWTGLNKYDGEREIVYTVKEVEVPEGYTAEVTGGAGEFTVTNTHEPEPPDPDETEVSVTKVWDDKDDKDGIRPASVTVQLYAGDKAEGEAVTLTEGSDWTHTWTGLKKYADGKEIAYTVKEVKVPKGYRASVTGSQSEGYTITNSRSRIPGTGDGSHMGLWIGVMAVSLIGLLCAVIFSRKKRAHR